MSNDGSKYDFFFPSNITLKNMGPTHHVFEGNMMLASTINNHHNIISVCVVDMFVCHFLVWRLKRLDLYIRWRGGCWW